MVTQPATSYDEMFATHDKDRDRRLKANADLADAVWTHIQPASVVDVGCGMGFFLAAAKERGAEITGVDGDWTDGLDIAIPREAMVTQNLEAPLTIEGRFELASTLEVAEHLSPERGESFVADLVALSDRVLFSAAVPGQNGTGHINLRWQSYWAELFAAHGYSCYDALRRQLAGCEGMFPWFLQNTLLFIKDGTHVPRSLRPHKIVPAAADLVIPMLHERQVRRLRKQVREARRERDEARRALAARDTQTAAE